LAKLIYSPACLQSHLPQPSPTGSHRLCITGLGAGAFAQTQQPLTPGVTIHRLGADNNALGFYRVDDLTALIDGLALSDVGYLHAAFARVQADDLLLTSEQLLRYGELVTFTDLSLNLNEQYGLIIAVDGNPNAFYSFSEVNPS
jgi:hypothetical protein